MKVYSSGINLNTSTSGAPTGGVRHPAQVGQPQPLGHVLFGKARPKRLSPSDYKHLRKKLRKARAMKRKLAFLAGDEDAEYSLQLAEHDYAMIDEDGTIYIGRRFLEEYGDEDEILAGVLGHEVGHRPKTWPKLPPDVHLTIEQRHQLTREEEGKADWFMGRALEELGYSPERVCALLAALDDRANPSKDYYPIETRVAIIREAHASQRRRRNTLKALSPGAAKWRAAGTLIGDDV